MNESVNLLVTEILSTLVLVLILPWLFCHLKQFGISFSKMAPVVIQAAT